MLRINVATIRTATLGFNPILAPCDGRGQLWSERLFVGGVLFADYLPVDHLFVSGITLVWFVPPR